ncbi:hypothetical protein ACTXM3_09335 [Glutamicibacter arilaitensis]|uniref:hypothetical protein n=1 Tax=Glutamicibacter arilaitensis TaxID=256701 RepID=UPI003FD37798
MSYHLFIRGEAPAVDAQKVAETEKALEAVKSKLTAVEQFKSEEYWKAYRAHENAENPGQRYYKGQMISDFMQLLSCTGMGKYTFAPTLDVEEPDEGDLEAEEEFMKAVTKWRSQSVEDDDVTGIPLHKLGSNDGWIITQSECIEALSAWDEIDVTELDADMRKIAESDEWKDFLDYLEWAYEHRGIEVS